VDAPTAPVAAIKYIAVDRNQLRWEALDLDRLIPADHAARIIWEVSASFDLSGFEEQKKSTEGSAGRPCWPPQLLVSLWVYAYSIGVASARAIERLMEHEPAMRWLAGGEVINHHTLADFRVQHKAALEDLFAQFLALLDSEGVLDLSTILHDGTKVRTVAGRSSFHRKQTLEKRLRKARKVVRELDRRAEQDGEAQDQRREAAQRRAAQHKVERLQAAVHRIQALERTTPAGGHADLRVSETEADARNMKQPDGGWAPSYNVQVSTEAQSRMIVAVGVTNAANDTQELLPALERVAENCGEWPEQVIADKGYASRENVEQTAERGVDLIAPWKDDRSREAGACATNSIAPEFVPSAFRAQAGGRELTCPAGHRLVVIQQKRHHGVSKQVFEASAIDCRACAFRRPCCGNREGPRRIERVIESEAMRTYLVRMKRRAVQLLYRKRSEIAEFPNMWMKSVKKWRRFSVRGLVKADAEALWVALSYNMSQWIRIRAATNAVA
jgi:transposase